MFLHLSISHSVHDGEGRVCIGGGLHLGGFASRGVGSASREGGLHPGDLHLGRGAGQTHPWILWDTVNERAVRILLECILVQNVEVFSKLLYHIARRTLTSD